MTKPEHPIRRALREARTILLAAPLIAIAYNLFASTAIPWIREVRKGDTVSYDDLIKGSPTPSATAPDTSLTHVQVAITTPTVDSTKLKIDSSKLNLAQKQDPKELQRIQDSIKKAIAAAEQRSHDSLANSMKNVPVKPDKPAETLSKEIGTATALHIFNDKKALFIDARPAAQFSEGHIPGAINVYAEEFRDHIPQLLNYPMDTLVVAYCGGGLCELSHELADQLRTFGFKKVVVYTGGTTEWNANNYPFTK